MEENAYCKHEGQHRLYHAIGEKCPCYKDLINTLGQAMAAPLIQSIDYQKLGRMFIDVQPLPNKTISLYERQHNGNRGNRRAED